MKKNKFIWADLSSYQPENIKQFYENVFDWKYYEDNGYSVAYKGEKEIVGLYETPSKFQTIKMPSFWMSYIQVNNIEKTIDKAKKLGGIVELVNLENSFGGIALIRDTLGAGFTVYEGDTLNSKTIAEEHTLIFNELHVSDAQKAIAFYQNLFNWNFEKIDDSSYNVSCNISNEKITTINQLNNSIKGKYEYWVCTFGVKDLKITIEKIKNNHGTIISDEGNRILCSDGSEAFFYIQEI